MPFDGRAKPFRTSGGRAPPKPSFLTASLSGVYGFVAWWRGESTGKSYVLQPLLGLIDVNTHLYGLLSISTIRAGRSFLGVALLSLLVIAKSFGQPSTIQSLYQKAREAEARKDYQSAVGCYEKILELDPTLHQMRANLGLMHYLNGEFSKAAQVFRQALQRDPNLYSARLFLGINLLELNQLQEGLSHLEKAVRTKPEDPMARIQLARGFYLSDRSQDALKHLLSLQEGRPDDPELLYLLGRVHMRLSLEAYEKLKKQNPDHYRIYQLLGENYEIQGLHGPAIANYRKALESNPKARGIYLKLGALYQASNDLDKALEAYRSELTNSPDAHAHYKLGSVLLDQGKWAEASQHLKMSLELNENSPPARAAYGRCLLELNQVQEAVVQLRKAVELDPSNATAYYQLARAYQRSGDAAAAQEALKMYEKLKDI